jgi:cephalosporin hydroxylase
VAKPKVILLVLVAGAAAVYVKREALFVKLARAFEPAVTKAFALNYHAAEKTTWNNTFWQGHAVQKNPMDLWVYQEIVHEVKPDVIVETGTYKGGSALYFAHLLDALGKGRVVTIDIEAFPGRPSHTRIDYLIGSSVDQKTVADVARRIPPGGTVMVSLDALHTRDHVLQELKLYAPLVTRGSYLVVDDTDFNGHPILPKFGPGPWEAVEEFLRSHAEFQPDRAREKFKLTWNPRGYLRRR